MRLKNYLNEATEPTIIEVKKIVKSKIPELYKLFNKWDFVLDDGGVVWVLDKVFGGSFRWFKKFHITFKRAISTQQRRANWFVKNADMDADGKMDIIMSPEVSKYLRKFVNGQNKDIFFDINKNALLRNIIETLNHEVVHWYQLKKSKGKFISPYVAKHGDYSLPKPIRKLDNSSEELRKWIGYYADPHEINAHAQDTAISLLQFNTSKSLKQYIRVMVKAKLKDETESEKKVRRKAIKRFLKRLTYFLQKIGNDKDLKPEKFITKNNELEKLIKVVQ